MKKIIVIVFVIAMALGLVACSGQETTVSDESDKKVAVGSIEELEEVVNNDVINTEASLRAEYDELATKIDTYDKYVENKAEVEAFYSTIYEETKAICIRMREYSIAYTEIVMKENEANDDKYDAMDDLYDIIYDDACGEIYDLIYDDLLGDMYDLIYDGVVEDGYEYTGYEQWADTSSEAYDMWSDSLSDVYDEWSDALSDIYDFWSDVCGHIYDGGTEDVNEEIEKFREEIEELKTEE